MDKIIKMQVEIPAGSNIKYEYDRKKGSIVVDRILREGFTYPANYGFVKEALDWDGDELDVLLFSPETFPPGVAVNARIVGAMKMIDTGETDTKLIAVHVDDYRVNHIQNIDQIPKKWLTTVETFFSTYKNWKRPGITSVNGFENHIWAIKEYEECCDLMYKYGSMEKDDFIELMKKKHPKKYVKVSI